MEHMFIKDWDQAREIQAYPPGKGVGPIYLKTSLINITMII